MINYRQAVVLAYYANPNPQTLAAIKRLTNIGVTRNFLQRHRLIRDTDQFPYSRATANGLAELRSYHADHGQPFDQNLYHQEEVESATAAIQRIERKRIATWLRNHPNTEFQLYTFEKIADQIESGDLS